jgi:hypothetical protein
MDLLREAAIAHSAPIYVKVAGTENNRGRAVAARYYSILCDMEESLADEHMEHLAGMIGKPMWDAVPKDILYNNRSALLEEIYKAKAFFTELMD